MEQTTSSGNLSEKLPGLDRFASKELHKPALLVQHWHCTSEFDVHFCCTIVAQCNVANIKFCLERTQQNSVASTALALYV
jgi:hypothetical protein